MSADTLRKAASLMRERAKAATPGPWSAADEHGLLDGADPAWCVSNMRPGYRSMTPTDGYLGDVAETSLGFHADEQDGRNATHIASWHPAVALAVADWLEAEDAHQFGPTAEAIEVARAYLGSDA